MAVIRNIKDKFNTPEMFAVYSECMYMATWEKFTLEAVEYINSETTSIFGYYLNDQISGIIVIVQPAGRMPVIRGIAVGSAHRKQGIGKRLIQYACNELDIPVLTAETDDDAVSFYRHCGFETEAFMRTFDTGEYKRYKCVLKNTNPEGDF